MIAFGKSLNIVNSAIKDLSNTMLGGVDLRFGGSASGPREGGDEELLLRRDEQQSVTVRPEMGFVVKTRDYKTREKIFINLTSSK